MNILLKIESISCFITIEITVQHHYHQNHNLPSLMLYPNFNSGTTLLPSSIFCSSGPLNSLLSGCDSSLQF